MTNKNERIHESTAILYPCKYAAVKNPQNIRTQNGLRSAHLLSISNSTILHHPHPISVSKIISLILKVSFVSGYIHKPSIFTHQHNCLNFPQVRSQSPFVPSFIIDHIKAQPNRRPLPLNYELAKGRNKQ